MPRTMTVAGAAVGATVVTRADTPRRRDAAAAVVVGTVEIGSATGTRPLARSRKTTRMKGVVVVVVVVVADVGVVRTPSLSQRRSPTMAWTSSSWRMMLQVCCSNRVCV